jgi:competence protein ComEA
VKISKDQLLGSFALLVVTAVLMLLSAPAQFPRETPVSDVPYSTQSPGAIAVELTGESGCNGIYFIPRGTNLAGFLSMTGIKPVEALEEPKNAAAFKSATTVNLLARPTGISVGPMAAEKRLALGIPIDINRSSRAELVLVPGIGEKTAEKILEQRSLIGTFRKLDELMLVKGIKEKRLEKLRKYLCIGC